jgi:hypothetical protein
MVSKMFAIKSSLAITVTIMWSLSVLGTATAAQENLTLSESVESMEQGMVGSTEEMVEDYLVKLGDDLALDCVATQRYAFTILIAKYI